MTSRERVLCAMRLEEPDRIPWLEEVIDQHAVLPIMDDWLSLGQSAINLIEPQAMDIRYVKSTYGDRVCIVAQVELK